LSNRPARGTFIACSGPGDCGGQVQGETCGGLVANRGMRPDGVVVGDPGRDQIAGMGQVSEQGLVQGTASQKAANARCFSGMCEGEQVSVDVALM